MKFQFPSHGINAKTIVMKTLNFFIENYKSATEGFNFLGKIFVLLVLAFIFIAVLFAIFGVALDFFS